MGRWTANIPVRCGAFDRLGCDKLLTAADLAPVRQAVAGAQRHGTSVSTRPGTSLVWSARTVGTGPDWPSLDDVGVDAVASIPEITAWEGTHVVDGRRGKLAPNRL